MKTKLLADFQIYISVTLGVFFFKMRYSFRLIGPVVFRVGNLESAGELKVW